MKKIHLGLILIIALILVVGVVPLIYTGKDAMLGILLLIAILLIYGFLIYYGFVSFRRKHWFRFTAVMLYLLYTISFGYTRWGIEKEYCYVDGTWIC